MSFGGGVFRPYPTQPIPRPNPALLPLGGGVVPVGGGVAAKWAPWWPDYPTQQRMGGAPIAAFGIPPFTAPVQLARVASVDYPAPAVRSSIATTFAPAPPLQLIAPNPVARIAPAGDYPTQNVRSINNPALATPPAGFVPLPELGRVASVDYPTQNQAARPLAALITPPDPVYVFDGLPVVLGATQRPDLVYPPQGVLTRPATTIPPPAGPFIYASAPPNVIAAARLDMLVSLRVNGFAPFTQPPAFLSPTPLAFWIREATLTLPPSISSSASIDAQQQAGYVAPRALARTDRLESLAPTLSAAQGATNALPTVGSVPASPTLRADRVEPAPVRLSSASTATMAQLPAPVLASPMPRTDRREWPTIQPIRVLRAVYPGGLAIQLAPGEIILLPVDDRIVSITVDDRRIYPVPSTGGTLH